ncbi:MAG: hypothetical protein M3Z35_01710, partial [Nitrospirota bacterium]|nr:hypothetical protein [Nitrospirota bacterium]
MQPIPHSSCFKILPKLVESKYRLALELNGRTQYRFTPTFGVLSFATFLESQDPDVLAADQRELRTFLLTKSSYGRDKVRDHMEELLSLDAHLKSCCVDIYGLART